MNVGERVAAGDISLFAVETQTSLADRRSLLRLQELIRRQFNEYTYLEVGWHIGGSIFPHLVDERCSKVISIDARPPEQFDERGAYFKYDDNTVGRMLRTLEHAAGTETLRKLQTHTAIAGDVDPTVVAPGVRLALIDAEHTNRAAFDDFVSVLRMTEHDSIIAFHDANILTDALWNVMSFLRFLNLPFSAFFLPDVVFALALGRLGGPAVAALTSSCLDPERFYQDSKRWLRSMQRA